MQGSGYECVFLVKKKEKKKKKNFVNSSTSVLPVFFLRRLSCNSMVALNPSDCATKNKKHIEMRECKSIKSDLICIRCDFHVELFGSINQ